MRKGLIIFAIVIAFVFTLLYAVPQFINFNNYKNKFADEITKIFEVPIQIDGDISMEIIPRGYIIVKDIKILNNDKSNTVLSVGDFYIEISLMDLLDIENIKLSKVILSGLNVSSSEDEQSNSTKQMLSKILSGNLFNKIQTIQIQNSNIIYKNKINN
ncbi:MAG: AsmA family protein, partial [Rickettsiales bacterium]|nr:AsmA family protein [Rickettsiales bacterium]